TLACIIADLNPLLKGWFAYFKHAHPSTFRRLDQFIRRRLRAVLHKQTWRRAGMGLALADHLRWPNAFFAQAGLLELHTVWQIARHSRSRNRRLESRIRENRPYGSEGGEGSTLPDPYERSSASRNPGK